MTNQRFNWSKKADITIIVPDRKVQSVSSGEFWIDWTGGTEEERKKKKRRKKNPVSSTYDVFQVSKCDAMGLAG